MKRAEELDKWPHVPFVPCYTRQRHTAVMFVGAGHEWLTIKCSLAIAVGPHTVVLGDRIQVNRARAHRDAADHLHI